MSNGTNSSGRGGGAGGGGANQTTPATPANTPSGVTYEGLMQMTDAQKYQTIQDILNDKSIKVPRYLDRSDTTKVMYALGMDNKPTVVSDQQLNSMSGTEIFRTVYEQGKMPPPSSEDILDQIRTGDYTCLSDSGGSRFGKAIYFANDFFDSARYGNGGTNSTVMRGKINPNANFVQYDNLRRSMRGDTTWGSTLGQTLNGPRNYSDAVSIYALTHGIDGWFDTMSGYSMVLNRGSLTVSSQNKEIGDGTGYIANSWRSALSK